jgi:ATP-dependent helicase/nuclease subunit A
VRAATGPNRQLHEEMPFTLVLPACEVYADCTGLAPDDKVLVQGIIDCWFEMADGIILVDYKSDHLAAEPLLCQDELAKRYRLQLDYYARAIQAATGKTVTRRLIWLIRQSRAFELTAGEAPP